MGAWGPGILDNDTTLDFVDGAAENLRKRLASPNWEPTYADFYCAAIFLHGIKSVMEDGERQNVLGGKHRLLPCTVEDLCKTFVERFVVVIRNESEDFSDVLYRQLEMVQKMLLANEAEQVARERSN